MMSCVASLYCQDLPKLAPAAEAPPTHVLLVLEGSVPAAAAADMGALALAFRATSPRPGRLVVCNASSAALPTDLLQQDDRLFPGTSSGLMDAFSSAQSLAFAGPGRLLVLSAAGAQDAAELLPPVMMEGLLTVPSTLAPRVLHLALEAASAPQGSLGLPYSLRLYPKSGGFGGASWAEMPARLFAILRTGNFPDFLPGGRLDAMMLLREVCRQSPGWEYAASVSPDAFADWPLASLPSEKSAFLRSRILARLQDPVADQTLGITGQLSALRGRVDTLPSASLASGAGALDRLVLGADPAGVECLAWLATLPKPTAPPSREQPVVRPTKPPAIVMKRPMPPSTKPQSTAPTARVSQTSTPRPAPERMAPQPTPANQAPAATTKEVNPFKGGTRRIAF